MLKFSRREKLLLLFILVPLIFFIFIFFFPRYIVEKEDHEYGNVYIEKDSLVSKSIDSLKKEPPFLSVLNEEDQIEEKQIEKYNEKFGDDIFLIPENQKEEDFKDEMGIPYSYQTLNQDGLLLPLPKGYVSNPKGSFVYFSSDQEEYKGIEISVRAKWIPVKKYNYRASEVIFVRDIYSRLAYHDAYDNKQLYTPYPEGFEAREPIVHPETNEKIGMRVYGDQALFIMTNNPVFSKKGFVCWNFLTLEDRLLQITVMSPSEKKEEALSISNTMVSKIKRSFSSDIPMREINKVHENQFMKIGYSSSFKVVHSFFSDQSGKTKFIFEQEPLNPEYFMQMFIGKMKKGEVANRKETIMDLRASDIFDEIKDYLYLTSTPRDISRSYYQMHNLITRKTRISGLPATENRFQMLYDSFDYDTDELPDGSWFTIYLIDYSEDEFIVVMFNYSEYQKKIAGKYIQNIMKTVEIKK